MSWGLGGVPIGRRAPLSVAEAVMVMRSGADEAGTSDSRLELVKVDAEVAEMAYAAARSLGGRGVACVMSKPPVSTSMCIAPILFMQSSSAMRAIPVMVALAMLVETAPSNMLAAAHVWERTVMTSIVIVMSL